MLWLWAMLVFGLAIRAFARGLVGEGPRGEVEVNPIVVDVNVASVVELTALPGIGPHRAEAIVLHRIRHGPFRSIDQLALVDGLGPDTCEMVRPFAACGRR
jgi:competence ComEA-like helix-hairpin-helix protein